MKFSCEKTLLTEAVMAAARAVPQKSAVQVLEGILLCCDGNTLKLTGYDLDTGIESTIEASVQQKGRIVLNARMLSEIVRKLPGGTVSFYCDEKNIMKIQSAATEFSLSGIDAADYPEIPEIETERTMALDEFILKRAINQTLFAVSDNENRPVLTGSLFSVKNNELTVVSVDGFRLAMRKQQIENTSGEGFSFIVPGRVLSEVSRLIGDKDRKVYISLARKNILFKFDNITIISRLLDGEFIDYEGVIPKDTAVTAEAGTAELVSAVERASLVVSEKIKTPVIFYFDFDKLKVISKSSLGSVYDEIDVKLTGEPLEIGLNSAFLLDALRACDSDVVRIGMTTPLSPIVMTAPENSDFLFLVVPMRYKTNE